MEILSDQLGHSQGNSNKNLHIQEPLFYHNQEDQGYFSVWYKDIDGIKENNRQYTYPLKDMEYALNNLDTKQNCFITQAEFSALNRRKANFKRIGLNFLDIDACKAEKEPTLEDILDTCEKEDEMPSLVIASGGGFYPKWLNDKPIETEDLDKWSAIQHGLCEKFKHLGADPKALDISRVLRVEKDIYSRMSQPP